MKVLAAIISALALSMFVALPAFAADSVHQSTQQGYVQPGNTNYETPTQKKTNVSEVERSIMESRENGIH